MSRRIAYDVESEMMPKVPGKQRELPSMTEELMTVRMTRFEHLTASRIASKWTNSAKINLTTVSP